jgi:phenylalanyl-tRNA synthetase alpha chain
MYIKPIDKNELESYLAIEDLTRNKHHAIGQLSAKIMSYMKQLHPDSDVRIYRRDPIVTIENNYDNLLIDKGNISRSSTYTHYVDKNHILRTHTSAEIPVILRELAEEKNWDDVVILLPGLAYRRDVTDKKHVGQVHMLEMWRVVKRSKIKDIKKPDLLKVVNGVAETAAPGWGLRIIDSPHPYTEQGIEVNACHGERDIEILECGLIRPAILENAGLDPEQYSGWALGMGLDRLVMTLKDIPDIRYLRSTNPRIASQMTNLDKYKEVSLQPAISRDMSYSVPEEYVEEDINEDIRIAMGEKQNILESVEILSETKHNDLPEKIKKRLGISVHQKNVLVRITLRHLERSLENKEANQIYNDIYAEINHGSGGYA